MTIPTYEVMEALCVIDSGTQISSFLDSYGQQIGKGRNGSSAIYFVTVGERGIVRIWNSEWY